LSAGSLFLAILPGDLGFGALFLGILFTVIAIGVIGALIAVVWSTSHPDEGKKLGMEKHEKSYALIFLAVVLIFATSTLGLLPYPYAHPGLKPTVTVNVRAQQWQWCLAFAPSWGTNCQPAIPIRVGSIVLFNTSSIDVTHGFGLYSPTGQLLDQVQVVPGYYDNMIFQFTTPGIYYIRCLEFCGWGHFGMVSEINITS
jgi:cytochrome c oxidase subunit II